MTEELRKTGIDRIGDMPWGAHFCYFYDMKKDLLDTLVPYFKAGLEDQEFCAWVVSDPLTEEEARNALRQAVPEFDRYASEQSIEIFLARKWYLKGGKLALQRVIAAWNEKLDQALTRGYAGMRASGNTAWLNKEDWQDFLEYEKELNELIANRRMIVLCTYQLASNGAAEILDVVRSHQSAVAKRHGYLEVVETSELKQAKEKIKKLNKRLEQRVVERTRELEATNEALRQSESDLAEAQRLARLGSWSLDIPTNAVRWSEELYRIFDVEKTAFDGTFETFLSRVDPDDRTRILQVNAEARSRGEPFELEYRITTQSGQLKHIREVGYARKDSTGTVSDLFGTAQDITERKRVEEALADYTRRLQSLSGRLLEAQESERRRIALELHDEIGQSLTAIKIQLQALQSQSNTTLPNLEECIRSVDQAFSKVRDLSLDLRPPQLEDLGLSAALRWHLDRQVQAAKLVPHFLSEPLPALRPDLEIACFRVAQEALTNVIRHANAHQVWVELRQHGAELHLIIKDDGQGFDVNAARERAMQGASMGLLGMQERVELVGGRFELNSSPGRGTEVHAVFPLTNTVSDTRKQGEG